MKSDGCKCTRNFRLPADRGSGAGRDPAPGRIDWRRVAAYHAWGGVLGRGGEESRRCPGYIRGSKPTLKEIDKLADEKEKSVRLPQALIPYRDRLRRKGDPDALIVFVHYEVKQPADLPSSPRQSMERFVTALDTPRRAGSFQSGRCPRKYLKGNLNLYPLDLENRTAQELVDFGTSEDAPVLEIRFTGLKGVFKHLIGEMGETLGREFVHLDGDSL